MANSSYASAVRAGTMAASRLHRQFGTRDGIDGEGGNIDVFGALLAAGVPLLLRPLKSLLGAYLNKPEPGVLVTTERPMSIQRFTAAHELGHFWLKHSVSLDDENMLRRSVSEVLARSSPNLQEVEADAFAVAFMMPRWLIAWHCERQDWLAKDLAKPEVVYQLSLRLGASYEATCWTLMRYKLVSPAVARDLTKTKPRSLKAALLQDYSPPNYSGDVWLLTDRDADTRIDGSRNDTFILRVNEHSSGGYLWDLDQLRASGFSVVSERRDDPDWIGVGNTVVREITATPNQPFRGHVAFNERRPWLPTEPLAHFKLKYDLSGPEEQGLSRVERQHLLEAA